mgnify:CR=1 FL=1
MPLALLLLGLAFGAHMVAGGQALSAHVQAVVVMAMVALHIQLARGMLELHFGVFVTLAYLLMYRDWKVLVLGAAGGVGTAAIQLAKAAGAQFVKTSTGFGKSGASVDDVRLMRQIVGNEAYGIICRGF